jgi:hypothetical protein
VLQAGGAAPPWPPPQPPLPVLRWWSYLSAIITPLRGMLHGGPSSTGVRFPRQQQINQPEPGGRRIAQVARTAAIARTRGTVRAAMIVRTTAVRPDCRLTKSKVRQRPRRHRATVTTAARQTVPWLTGLTVRVTRATDPWLGGQVPSTWHDHQLLAVIRVWAVALSQRVGTST